MIYNFTRWIKLKTRPLHFTIQPHHGFIWNRRIVMIKFNKNYEIISTSLSFFVNLILLCHTSS